MTLEENSLSENMVYQSVRLKRFALVCQIMFKMALNITARVEHILYVYILDSALHQTVTQACLIILNSHTVVLRNPDWLINLKIRFYCHSREKYIYLHFPVRQCDRDQTLMIHCHFVSSLSSIEGDVLQCGIFMLRSRQLRTQKFPNLRLERVEWNATPTGSSCL